MIIRKKFKFEGSHVVRNCSTARCSQTIHGHSYIVEVKIKAKSLDKGGMVMDFSLLKTNVKELIDSFDHSLVIWKRESKKFRDDMALYSERIIELPLTSSAECLSIQLFYLIDKILKNTTFMNNEDPNLELYSVIVHETDTGYAEAYREDIPKDLVLDDFYFSDAIVKDWSNPYIIDNIVVGSPFINPQPFKQI